MQIVKVQYYKEAIKEFTGYGYSYYTEETLKVGDIVKVPVKDGELSRARVCNIDCPESEIEKFKDKVKTIPAGSIIKPEIIDSKINLCDVCIHRKEYPTCESEDVKFGDGIGNDNIIICHNYKGSLAAAAHAAGAEVKVVTIEESTDKTSQSVPADTYDPVSPDNSIAVININPYNDMAVINLRHEIVKLSNYAGNRIIKSDTDLTPATDDLVLVSKLKKALKEKQAEYVNPIKEHLDKVQFVFKDLLSCLLDIEIVNKDKIFAYTNAQKARAAEAERLNCEAEELARKQAAFNNGEFTVNTTPIEAPVPVKKVSTLSGSVSEVKAPNTWELEDFDKVPNQYKILDTVRINQLVRAGGSIPGIKIITNTTIRTTTK
jgi:hypothetical protein